MLVLHNYCTLKYFYVSSSDKKEQNYQLVQNNAITIHLQVDYLVMWLSVLSSGAGKKVDIK